MSDEQLQEALRARSPAATVHAQHGHVAALRQGDHGESTGRLQADLVALGVTARDGSPLRVDSHFGRHTKEAVEAFQRDHGLGVDGIAGPATIAALSEAKRQSQAQVPSLLDARHPAHGIYEQAFACVSRIDEAQGRQPGSHTQALAGSLTSAALAAGFNRIDHVVLSDDASRGWAVQGDLKSPFKQYTEVNVMQSIQTPLGQSSRDAALHLQTQDHAQQHQAQQLMPPAADLTPPGPVMTR